MPRYEMYNTETAQVDDVLEMSGAEAEQRNKDNAAFKSPYRYIPQQESPDMACTCGAHAKHECVCNFDYSHY